MSGMRGCEEGAVREASASLSVGCVGVTITMEDTSARGLLEEGVVSCVGSVGMISVTSGRRRASLSSAVYNESRLGTLWVTRISYRQRSV